MPRQASENRRAVGRLVVDESFADGLLGLEQYRHIWLVTWLHEQGGGETALRVVPAGVPGDPGLQGVFATRSPRRPNSIGLSLVRLLEVNGSELRFDGVDLLDGTPVLDVK